MKPHVLAGSWPEVIFSLRRLSPCLDSWPRPSSKAAVACQLLLTLPISLTSMLLPFSSTIKDPSDHTVFTRQSRILSRPVI